MQLTFTDTDTGCTLKGSTFSTTWNQAVPLDTAATKALIASLIAEPDLAYVEDAGVVIKRNDNGVSIQTRTGSFDIHWSILVTIPDLFA